MKQKIFIALYCLLSVFVITACSDDDENIRPVDPDELLFKVTELEASTTSYTFQIDVSSNRIPYLCLYVDKEVIDKIPRPELHNYLMEDLKKQAEAKGVAFEEYLGTISHRGSISKHTISNLLAGKMYELVLFGINGTEAAKKPHCHYFQTWKVDPISCNFDVQVDVSGKNPIIDVKPENKETQWYCCVIDRPTFDAAKAQGMNEALILQSYFSQELDYYLGMMAPDGNVTQEILDEVLAMLLRTGDQQLELSGSGILADTEYIWMGIAVYVTSDYELMFISDITMKSFKTKPAEMKETTFELEVDNIRQTKAHVKITPSDLKQVYVCRIEELNPTTEKMRPDELARHIVATNPWIQFEAQAHGVIEYENRGLIPGTKHCMVAFGYEGGICTKVARRDFDPAPPADPNTVEFEVETLNVTSDEISLKVTPSEESVYYIPLLYPASEDKEVIKGRLMSSWNQVLYQTQQQLNPYATIWTIIAQSAYLGTESMSYSDMIPGEKYTLMILTFNKEGICSDKDFRENFVTIPGLSSTTKVDGMKTFGIFNGDDEKGDIFGQPEATKGRAIIALSFNSTPDVKEAFSSSGFNEPTLDELDPNQLPDSEIISSNALNWSSMDARRPHMFLVADWGADLIAYSFGVNEKGERGTIARAQIPVPLQNNVGNIQDLKDLVDELNGKSASAFMKPEMPAWEKSKKEIDIRKCMGTRLDNDGQEVKVPLRPEEPKKMSMKQVWGKKFYLPVANPI